MGGTYPLHTVSIASFGGEARSLAAAPHRHRSEVREDRKEEPRVLEDGNREARRIAGAPPSRAARPQDSGRVVQPTSFKRRKEERDVG